MPYVKKEVREYFKKGLELIADAPISGPGYLNYVLTCLSQLYLAKHGEGYQTYNDIIGALECCKLEMYRRKTSPFEDKKIIENGDVY